MKFWTLLIFIVLPFVVVAQDCPPGSVSFYTQNDVDQYAQAYPNCTYINGQLTINGFVNPRISDLSTLSTLDSVKFNINILNLNDSHTDISFLSNIKKIGGYNLNVSNSQSLTTLGDLNELTELNRLNVENCGDLENLGSFNALIRINEIDVFNCSSLESFFNFPLQLDEIHSSEVRNCESFQNFGGLENVKKITGTLMIYNCNNFNDFSSLSQVDSIFGSLDVSYGYFGPVNFNGLSNLVYIGSYLDVSSNFGLESFEGLENLNRINTELRVSENNNFTDFAGLHNLNYLPRITLFDNNSLLSLNGLDNIDSDVLWSVSITENQNLAMCSVQGICEYMEDHVPYQLYDNQNGCNSRQEVLDGCAALPVQWNDITIEKSNECNNIVNWIVSNEINVHKYMVEISENGESYENILNIYPQGGNALTKRYSERIEHKSIVNAKYLRIISEDHDGSRSFSPIVNVPTCNTVFENVFIFPNPVDNMINIIEEQRGQLPEITYELYNSHGNNVKTGILIGNQIEVSELQSGLYILSLKYYNRCHVTKFMKK